MKIALRRKHPGPGGMLAFSLVCHLVVFLVIANWSFYPEYPQDETPVTYVDMVTLPVASPQSGVPAPAEPAAAPAAAPAPAPPPPAAPAMALPTKPAVKTPAKPQAKTEQQEAAEAKAYSERLAKLQQQAEERRQADVLERLRKGAGTRTGMPGAKGTQAGSDYASYLQSRLKDALREVMATQTRAPQVIATITVSPEGRIECRVDKGSGDPLFDDAVQRAVALAGKTLVPPPNRSQFKHVFRFMPEGVR